MSNLPKGIFSLLIAIILIALLLILPDASVTFQKQINYLTKSDNTAVAFGYYLLQKFVSSAIILLLTVGLSIAGHRAIKKHRSELN